VVSRLEAWSGTVQTRSPGQLTSGYVADATARPAAGGSAAAVQEGIR
jgi:hypothetical protein